MSTLEEQFEQHAVHKALTDLREALERFGETSAEEAAQVERCRSLAAHTTQMLRNVDPTLTSTAVLEPVSGGLNEILERVNEHLGGQPNRLELTERCVVEVLRALALFPIPPTQHDGEALTETAVRYRTRVSGLLRGLEDESDKLKKNFAFVEDSARKIESRLESYMEKAERTAEVFREAERETTQVLQEGKNQASSGFSAELDLQKGNFSALFERIDAENAQRAEDHTQRVDALLKELDKKRVEAAKIVGLVSNIGVAGNYKLTAEKEGKAADRWRSISLFLWLIAILIVALIVLTHPDAAWTTLIFRVTVGALLAVPAIYAARESSRHRSVELTSRKMELELAALDPFLETLPADERSALKAKLTERFFGASVEPREDGADVVSIKTLIDLIKIALKSKQ